MPSNPDIYRNIPFRPPAEKRTMGSFIKLVSRFFREYCMGYRNIFILCIFLEITANFIAYTTTFTAKHMVDEILVIEQKQSKTDASPSVLLQGTDTHSLAEQHHRRIEKGIGSKTIQGYLGS